MPIYRFVCEICKAEVNEFRPIANRDFPLPCRECGGPTKRMLDVASVHFVGEGFYSNDK